jgi:hypothetical protein
LRANEYCEIEVGFVEARNFFEVEAERDVCGVSLKVDK